MSSVYLKESGKLSEEGKALCEALLPELLQDATANMGIAHQTLAAKFPPGAADKQQLEEAILTYLSSYIEVT